MRIESVRAYAFGPLVDETLDLAPGMTVVHGPNESGKSSWHAALYAGLCGMRRGAGLKKQDKEFANRHRPWAGDAWEISATVELSDNRRMELHHDLDGKVDCWAHDADLGRDHSNEIIHDGAPDGARWLGLDRRSFLSTACVRQADIQSVFEQAGDLQNELQRAAATAGTDSTAAAALQRLKNFRRENIGQDRSNSIRPLRTAKKRHERARQRLDDANEAHANYLDRLEEIEWLRKVKEDAERSLKVMEAALAVNQAVQREKDAQRARALSNKYPAEPRSWSESSKTEESVNAALVRWFDQPDEVELQGQTAEELRRELDRLPLMPTDDTKPHESVVAARGSHTFAHSALERHREDKPSDPPVIETGGLDASQLRELAGELALEDPVINPKIRQRIARAHERVEESGNAAMPQPPRASRPIPLILRPVAFLIRMILAPFRALFTATHRSSADQVARIKMLEEQQKAEAELREAEAQLGNAKYRLEEMRRRRSEAEDKAVRHGLPIEPETLKWLAKQVEQADQMSRDLEQWETQEEQHAERFDEAERILCKVLRERGVANVSSPVDAVAGYEKECAERGRAAREASRRPDLKRAYEERQQAESLAKHSEQLRREAGEGLRAVAEAVDVTGDTDDEIAARLGDWHRNYQDDLKRLDVARAEWNELQGLLDGGNLHDLEGDAAQRRCQAERLAEGLEQEKVAGVRVEDDVESQLDKLRRDVSASREALSEKEGGIEQYAKTMPSVTEAEEELESAKAELRRVERLDRTLEHTWIFLKKAQDKVHRTVAPLLREAVKPWLHQVTGGRYTDVRIDAETLLVRVSGDGRSWREAPLLSHGTAEQVYLLLRVAMARLLTRKEESCPLVFDDVTVNCDPQRHREMLNILHTISTEQQVIVFSQEPETFQWAQEHLVESRDRLVELPLSEIQV